MKRFTVEQVIHHLREADVLLAQCQTVGEVRRRIEVSEQSYYRQRNGKGIRSRYFSTIASR